MPIPWEKVISHRPHMLSAARGWYHKWIRGERLSANDAAESRSRSFDDMEKIEAYAEPVKIEDVIEVRETTKDVAGRLEALEFAGMAQAETVKNLTAQYQSLMQSLSKMQRELTTLDQNLQDAHADAQGHKSSLERVEMDVQTLSGNVSRLSARINMALWMASVSVVGSIVAISLAFLR